MHLQVSRGSTSFPYPAGTIFGPGQALPLAEILRNSMVRPHSSTPFWVKAIEGNSSETRTPPPPPPQAAGVGSASKVSEGNPVAVAGAVAGDIV